MGGSQSIDKNVPEEFAEDRNEKSLPKTLHLHKPKLHNFHGDYYQNDQADPSPSIRRPSRMESGVPALPSKSPIFSANASTYDLVEEQKAKEEISYKKNYSNRLEVNSFASPFRSQGSFSECEMLSMHSIGTPNIRKVWLDKQSQSLVKRAHFWETLPLQASFKILEYCIDDLNLLLQVDSRWKQRIKSILYFKSSSVVTQFKNKFYKQLTLSDHKIMLKKMNIQKTGKARMVSHRLEVLLTCQVEKTLAAKSVNLSYKYQMHSKGNQDRYSNHVFDVCAENDKKLLWFYTEQRKVLSSYQDKPEGRSL